MLKKIMLVSTLALFAWCVQAQVPDNWYEHKQITAIVFKGLKSVTSSELDGVFSSFKGKLFSDDVYADILQKLYALDYFSNIIPKALPADSDYQFVRLEFEVTEKPVISLIKMLGNRRMGSGDLLSRITLKKGAIYSEEKRLSAEQVLKNYYIENGYATATVNSKITEGKDGSVIVEFEINEGRQTIVAAVAFQGNTLVGEKKLKRVLVTKPKHTLTMQKGVFQEKSLEEDKAAIQQYYGERGYIDAHVENIIREVDTTTDPQRNQIKLTYVIMEGEQYTYGGTVFEGNRIFSTEVLAPKIKLETGSVLNMTKFKRGLEAVADTYYSNGYNSTYIGNAVTRDEATRKASFVITIVEGNRSHIENIIIRGNKRTKDYVIRRELLLEPGDVFSRSKFLDSQRNLFNLRYFSAVVPDMQQGSEKDLVDIILNVEEQSTANVQFGLSFSGASDADTFPISLFVQWQERNLAGRGNELSAGGTASTDTQTVQLGYTENWLFGYPVTVGFDFSISHKLLYDFENVIFPYGPFGSPEALERDPAIARLYRMRYNRLETSFGIHTGYRWFPRYCSITLRGGVNFSLGKNFYDSSIHRPLDAKVLNQQTRPGLSNSLWSRVSFDGRDLAYDPSKGWFISEQVSFFGIIPKVEDEYFFRAETKTEAYVTLLNYPVSDIWNLKFVLAFYTNFTFQVPMPDSRISSTSKLLIDGMFVGRGWVGLGYAGKGDVQLNHWIEFRWPLAHGILSFDFFFDAAAVKKNIRDLRTLSINDYYFSFGPGLRFVIPQFPLRLMFANTFRSVNGKPVWGNGKNADWKFVLSFSIPNL